MSLDRPVTKEWIDCTRSLDVTNRNLSLLYVSVLESVVTIHTFTAVMDSTSHYTKVN
jgi:hypothetical protein